MSRSYAIRSAVWWRRRVGQIVQDAAWDFSYRVLDYDSDNRKVFLERVGGDHQPPYSFWVLISQSAVKVETTPEEEFFDAA